MRTIETILYKFDELSETAKAFAIENYIDKYFKFGTHLIYNNEISESFSKAEEIYQSLENIEGEIKGARLYTWLINNVVNEWVKSNYFYFDKNNKITHDYFSFKYTKRKYKKSHIFKTNTIEDCPMTGVFYDWNFLEPIINFIKTPDLLTTNLDLAELLPSFESICQKEYEYRTTKECIIEDFVSNEVEFYENGKQY